ncbi:hypothetical protein DL93DRAFT_1288159 [Clavulina sp. PMI_390]|nr:hypothetical protein DL93DRAFT_1288159 [Clavulina sp. PMI_390]
MPSMLDAPQPSTLSHFPTPLRVAQLAASKPFTTTASPSPSPSKRRRLGSTPSSSSAATPNLDDEDDLYRKRYTASMGVLSFWNSLEAKYARDLADDDIVDLFSQKIVQDKGVIRGQPERRIGSFVGATSSKSDPADGTSTPLSLDASDEEEDEEPEQEEEEDEFDSWSNLPDHFGRLSPRKPFFGKLPLPFPSTTDEEDLASFMAAEEARWEREGDFDAQLDARLREERAARQPHVPRPPSSASEVSLSTIGGVDDDSADEMNLGYTPSPRKSRVYSSRPSFTKLDAGSSDDDRDLAAPLFGWDPADDDSDDPIDLFNIGSGQPITVPKSEESSDDELLLTAPISSPRKTPHPAQNLPRTKFPQGSGALFELDDSDSDPLDMLGDVRRSVSPTRKYPTPLSPSTPSHRRKAETLRFPSRPLSPPNTQLHTPPLSNASTEPIDLTRGTPLSSASSSKGARINTNFNASSLVDDAINRFRAAQSMAPPLFPSAKGKERAFDFDFGFTAPDTPLPTPSTEPSESDRPSALRRGPPSPEKAQRTLKFDLVPQFVSVEKRRSRSRSSSPVRTPSPEPPLSPSSPSLRAPRRSASPQSPKQKKRGSSLPVKSKKGTPSLGKRKRQRSPVSDEESEPSEEEMPAKVLEKKASSTRQRHNSKAREERQASASEDESAEEDDDPTPVKQKRRPQKQNRDRRTTSLPPSLATSDSTSQPSSSLAQPLQPPAIPQPQPLPQYPLQLPTMYSQPPPQPTYQPFGYPNQYPSPSPDPGMLSQVIHSLNFLAFSGFSAPNTPQTQRTYAPLPFAPPQAPPIPAPQWGYAPQMQPQHPQMFAMGLPMQQPAQPQYWPQMTPVPNTPQPPPPPALAPAPAAAPAGEEVPKTPRRRGRSSGEHADEARSARTRESDGEEDLPARSARSPSKQTRHGSLSPKKKAASKADLDSSTRPKQSRSRAKSQSVTRDDEDELVSSRRSRNRDNEDNDDGVDVLMKTPKKSKSTKNPFDRHHSTSEIPSTQQRQRLNPSPLRRSVTASDLLDDHGSNRSKQNYTQAEDEDEEDDMYVLDSPSKRSSRPGRSTSVPSHVSRGATPLRPAMKVQVEVPPPPSRKRWPG